MTFGCKIEVLKEHKMQLLSEKRALEDPVELKSYHQSSGAQASACLGLIPGAFQKAESDSGVDPEILQLNRHSEGKRCQ